MEHITEVNNENDQLLQETFSLKNKIGRLEHMNNILKDENESLFRDKQNKSDELEEERSLICKLKTQVKKLEDNLEEARVQIAEFREKEEVKTDERQKKEENYLHDNTFQIELLAQLDQFKSSNEQLKIELASCKQVNDMNVNRFGCQINSLQSELMETKALLKEKTDALIEINSHLESANENNALLQSELMTVKSAPADANCRGNSLFAEVEDKRKEIGTQLKTICAKYTKLKKLYEQKHVQHLRLTNEIGLLQQKCREDNNAPSKADARLIATQTSIINELETTVKDLLKKCDLSQDLASNDSRSFSWVKGMIDSVNKEAIQLRQEVYTSSINRWMIEQELHEKTVSLSQVRKEVVDLKMEVAKYKMNDDKECSSKEGLATESANSDNKENVNKKAVRFAP